jgi:hypothetical protein
MVYNQVSSGIFTVDNFMTKEECEQWIAFSETSGYEVAKINAMGRQIVNTRVRNNQRFIFDSEYLAEKLWERVAPFVPLEIEMGKAIGLNERFRFYKYLPGMRFRKHYDGSYIRNISEWSSYTFMLYLNEGMKGGATWFQNAEIEPKTGTALIFEHQLLHEGCEVIEGVKYVLRTDVMYRRKGM